MNNLGAIPKVKGGARPKTKVRGPINNQKDNVGEKANGANTVCDFSLEAIVPDKYVKTHNKKGNSFDQISPCSNLKNASSSKPLEEREILITDQGVQMKRSALSMFWVEQRTFIHYTRPPLSNFNGDFILGAVDAWIEQMEFLVEDLNWLLDLPHHKFWSQMVFDTTVQEWLESYLASGPRWYDEAHRDEGCQAVMSQVYQLVFLIFVRMATYKESKDDHITPAVFGNLIYDNYLFDICKMLDLCVLYGSTNTNLLEKMISNIFTHQNQYYADLEQLVVSLKSVLENLENKLGIFDSMTPRAVQLDTQLSFEEIHDAIFYVLDTFSSLQAFLSIFQRGCRTFHEKEFEFRLSSFYDKCIPKLVEELSGEVPEEADGLRIDLLEKVGLIRTCCLTVFREIVKWSCLQENSGAADLSPAKLGKNIEIFTHILTSVLEDRIFISDYYSMFGLQQDIEYFQSKGADMISLDFVKDAVESISTEILSQFPDQTAPSNDSKATDTVYQKETEVPDSSGMNGYFSSETMSLSTIDIESMISAVQDLLPDLGSGFIHECLKYYNYSSEEVLNAVLEGNLPPCVNELDRGLILKESDLNVKESGNPGGTPVQPEEKSVEAMDKPEVLVSRLNIYDDDEFDVFKPSTTKVSKTKVHKGKRDRVQYEKDPEITDKVKKIIHQYECNAGYSIYDDEEKYGRLSPTQYDDEYDDTYDDNDAGDVDTFEMDRKKRQGWLNAFAGRGALNTPGMTFSGKQDDSEEEGEGEKATEKGGRGDTRRWGEDVREKWREEPRGKAERNNERDIARFKRANVSYKRGNVLDDENMQNKNRLVFTNSRRGGRNETRFNGPGFDTGDTGDTGAEFNPESETSNDVDGTLDPSRPAFVPFCENPEEVRWRKEQKKQALQYRNKGNNQPRNNQQNQNTSNQNNQDDGSGTYSRGKTSTRGNKNSGKSWRQSTTEEENRRQHGGKYKEDTGTGTNHGKPQDRNYRHKMVHKNEQRRNAAQAKYRNNF